MELDVGIEPITSSLRVPFGVFCAVVVCGELTAVTPVFSRGSGIFRLKKFRRLLLFDHYFYKVDYRRFCGCHKYALVAQLDRVSDSDVSGQFS